MVRHPAHVLPVAPPTPRGVVALARAAARLVRRRARSFSGVARLCVTEGWLREKYWTT
jgi:hypothetical protein